MAKISDDCIKEAFDALKHFGKDELRDYVRDVFVSASEKDPLLGADAMEKAAKEVNDERLKSFFSDTTIKAKNIMAFEANANPIREGKADFRGVLAGRQRRVKYFKTSKEDSGWRKRNIPDAVRADYEKMIKFLLGDLTHEEVEHFSSGNFDNEICDIFDGKKSSDAFSTKIADKLKQYFEYSKSELILSTAMKPEEFHPKRYFSAVHDQQRIINFGKSLMKLALRKLKVDPSTSKPLWRDFIKKYLDMYETFKKTDAYDLKSKTLDMAKADKIIDTTFDNITTAKSNIYTRSTVANDRDAVERKSRMFYVWKNLRSQYDYNKTAGRGNLFSMLITDAQHTTQKTGTARMWGDNVYAMYSDLKKVQQEADPQDAKWWEHSDNYFKSVMKLDRSSDSPNAVNFFANLRQLSTMARLPLITLNSISDVGYIASFAQRFGDGYFKAWGYHLTHLLDSFPDENRKEIARLMKTQVDSHLGYLGRWTEVNNASDIVNKISTKFFKTIQLEAFDRGNKTGAMTLVGESLYRKSKMSWGSLPDDTRKYLDRFIDAKEWNLLRDKNNGRLFSTDNVDKLTEAELRVHYEKTDQSIPFSELKDDMYRRVHSMFAVAAENSVLSPSDFERAFIYHGTNPGQTLGVLTRMFGQFKQYTLAYVDRVLIDGLRNADTAQRKLIWATSLMMGTLPIAYASTWLANLLLGKSMPDPSRMNTPERAQYYLNLLQPSLAIFSGFLDPRNQNRDMLALIGSPSSSFILNSLAVPLSLAVGNTKNAKKEFLAASSYFIPTRSTPLISPLLDSALGDEAKLEPGQTRYFG